MLKPKYLSSFPTSLALRLPPLGALPQKRLCTTSTEDAVSVVGFLFFGVPAGVGRAIGAKLISYVYLPVVEQRQQGVFNPGRCQILGFRTGLYQP
eukprot:7380503-Prymnesium_polylepis.1